MNGLKSLPVRYTDTKTNITKTEIISTLIYNFEYLLSFDIIFGTKEKNIAKNKEDINNVS